MLQYESWELKQPLRFEDLLTDLAHRSAFNPSTTILSRSSPVLFDTSLESEKDATCGLLRKAADAYALHWENVVLKEPSRHFTIVGGGAEQNKNLFPTAKAPKSSKAETNKAVNEAKRLAEQQTQSIRPIQNLRVEENQGDRKSVV